MSRIQASFSPLNLVISSGYSVFFYSTYKGSFAEDCNFCYLSFFSRSWKVEGSSFLKCLAFRVCCTKCQTHTTSLSKERLLHVFCVCVCCCFFFYIVCTMFSSPFFFLYQVFLTSFRRILAERLSFIFHKFVIQSQCNRLLN